jgi:Xaa-Pro aminopeptidase
VLCFNFDNIRYVTGTHIGEWARDKFDALCALPARRRARCLWDPAPPAKRISVAVDRGPRGGPDHDDAGRACRRHGRPEGLRAPDQEGAGHYGIANKPIGIDLMELPMLRALEAEGIEVVDGQQAMLDAREVKTPDEIELPEAGGVDGGCDLRTTSCPAIRPGTRENELVAIANDRLFRLGSERVECVNSVSGPRGRPHSHTFSDRIIQPGDMIFLDIMHSATTATAPATTARSSAASRTSTRSKPTKRPRSGSPRRSTWSEARRHARRGRGGLARRP